MVQLAAEGDDHSPVVRSRGAKQLHLIILHRRALPGRRRVEMAKMSRPWSVTELHDLTHGLRIGVSIEVIADFIERDVTEVLACGRDGHDRIREIFIGSRNA